jgi:heat shock protein HslJ
MRARRRLAAGLVLAVLLLSGCTWTAEDTRSATQGLPDLRQDLAAQTWSLDQADSSLAPTTATEPITLRFGPGDLASGRAACNSYSGPFTIDGEALDLGPFAQTLIGCAPVLMKADTTYLAALEGVDRADTTDRDRLVLEGDGVRLAYTAADR